jgi:uncharacterized protein (TIGR02757 family)
MVKEGKRIHPEIARLLNDRAMRYNNPSFIELDPISIPHLFSNKGDIEISGFLTATISWGQRATILKNSQRLMLMMDNSPYDFISNFKPSDLKPFQDFVHRTFNGDDCIYFLTSLQNIYKNHGGLENLFSQENNNIAAIINNFKKVFFETGHLPRTTKHIADPMKGASAKRINMFLRWMARKDDRGVDFGIWNKITPSDLYIPLDIHSGNVARKLGILSRKQNDWKSVEELTYSLKLLDPEDPVKYDFALFGLGIFEGF